jgi:hypothetical protein
MKLHGQVIDPFSQESPFASPRVEVAAIEVEILLGLWLLSGLAPRASRLAALGFFVLMSGVSFYLAVTGQRSCGCFGRIAVSPWLTLGLDIAAVGLLARWKPVAGAELPLVRSLQRLKRIAFQAIAALALVGSAFLLMSDSPLDTLAQLRGDSITVDPIVSDVGDGELGDTRTFQVRLTNHTRHPVRVVGGTTTCSCIATETLPLTLLDGRPEVIEVSVRFSGSPGRFHHRFVLQTDDEIQPSVVARFTGRVSKRP